MTVSLADLPKGHEFAEMKFELTTKWVAEYRRAVEDETTSGSAVPPLSLGALAFRALLDQASLPDGAIHVSQEMNSFRGVGIGENVVVKARIGSKGERAGWVLMGVDLQVDEGGGDTIVNGRATITFPVPSDQPA
jgi:hypothetical protein